ncbi:helix-turn-helix domain-containing protein [Nocardioides nitrophenolicus]|uniref:AraC-like ligand-binding domain-containing protein n=1 Tax=Nocardioides nitrophenolicus TaxID=60489 RepID=UPI0019596FA9|nr:helix-turn-helix domain-containing protein [Nocardioides nitrophenolicus]MBM7518702.1 AraC-like DNA-binding protein [Nocardioides nitrophenolicus]
MTERPPPATRIDIEGLDAWTDACAQAYVPLRIDAIGEDFRGAIRERALGSLGITQVASTPVTVTRTARSIASDPRDTFMLGIFLRGAGTIVQDGRVATYTGAGGFLIDGDRPYSMRYEHHNDLLVLRLPRPRIGLRDRDLRELTSVHIPRDSSGLNVLRRYLAGLVAMRTPLTDVEEHQEVAVELTQALLHPMVYTERSRALLSGAAILASARWFIEQNHTDPRLTVDDVARHFMISRRYLEMLFTKTDGGGPATYLRRVRLSRAATLLASQPHLKIRQVSAQVGFSDINTFTRAFNRTYEATPSRWRRVQLVQPQPRLPHRPPDLLTDLDHHDWTSPTFRR